eukprot:TRINITY_DN548_c0_g2_i1.p1 TRINITY_DN548_c0_g2~~TRINITY_DN548_c0_g2_i1.p1  ORF type:complete len:1092 (+),score=228.99 TRINITY_DN548_c0_g2_i1:71-3346(+)
MVRENSRYKTTGDDSGSSSSSSSVASSGSSQSSNSTSSSSDTETELATEVFKGKDKSKKTPNKSESELEVSTSTGASGSGSGSSSTGTSSTSTNSSTSTTNSSDSGTSKQDKNGTSSSTGSSQSSSSGSSSTGSSTGSSSTSSSGTGTGTGTGTETATPSGVKNHSKPVQSSSSSGSSSSTATSSSSASSGSSTSGTSDDVSDKKPIKVIAKKQSDPQTRKPNNTKPVMSTSSGSSSSSGTTSGTSSSGSSSSGSSSTGTSSSGSSESGGSESDVKKIVAKPVSVPTSVGVKQTPSSSSGNSSTSTSTSTTTGTSSTGSSSSGSTSTSNSSSSTDSSESSTETSTSTSGSSISDIKKVRKNGTAAAPSGKVSKKPAQKSSSSSGSTGTSSSLSSTTDTSLSDFSESTQGLQEIGAATSSTSTSTSGTSTSATSTSTSGSTSTGTGTTTSSSSSSSLSSSSDMTTGSSAGSSVTISTVSKKSRSRPPPREVELVPDRLNPKLVTILTPIYEQAAAPDGTFPPNETTNLLRCIPYLRDQEISAGLHFNFRPTESKASGFIRAVQEKLMGPSASIGIRTRILNQMIHAGSKIHGGFLTRNVFLQTLMQAVSPDSLTGKDANTHITLTLSSLTLKVQRKVSGKTTTDHIPLSKPRLVKESGRWIFCDKSEIPFTPTSQDAAVNFSHLLTTWSSILNITNNMSHDKDLIDCQECLTQLIPVEDSLKRTGYVNGLRLLCSHLIFGTSPLSCFNTLRRNNVNGFSLLAKEQLKGKLKTRSSPNLGTQLVENPIHSDKDSDKVSVLVRVVGITGVHNSVDATTYFLRMSITNTKQVLEDGYVHTIPCSFKKSDKKTATVTPTSPSQVSVSFSSSKSLTHGLLVELCCVLHHDDRELDCTCGWAYINLDGLRPSSKQIGFKLETADGVSSILRLQIAQSADTGVPRLSIVPSEPVELQIIKTFSSRYSQALQRCEPSRYNALKAVGLHNFEHLANSPDTWELLKVEWVRKSAKLSDDEQRAQLLVELCESAYSLLSVLPDYRGPACSSAAALDDPMTMRSQRSTISTRAAIISHARGLSCGITEVARMLLGISDIDIQFP